LFSLDVKEAYVPPKNVKRWQSRLGLALSASQYKEICENRTTRLTFIALLVTDALMLSIVFVLLHLTLVSIIILFTVLAGSAWVNYQLLIYVRGVPLKQAAEGSLVFEDGWYQDPWSFGIPNRERLYIEGKWSEEVR